ncbi:MAG: serine hydrolase domain-containing protein [Christensenellales bacterium]|jgi:CubicO group peptidase (beta-lactamase class C family)
MDFNSLSDGISKSGLAVKSVVLIENDKKSTFFPDGDKPSNTLSITKTFVATALGICVDNGLMRTSDPFIKYFPELSEYTPGFELITIDNLLNMTPGHDKQYLMERQRPKLKETDYLQYVASRPLPYPPGKHFLYENSPTYLISRAVEKASGVPLREMLKEALEPCDIKIYDWLTCPMGYVLGGSTLHTRAGDMARLGLIYLNGGELDGKRIVSREWVEYATARRYDAPGYPLKDLGYGGSFWFGGIEGFRCEGRLGQYIFMLPKRQAVLAIISNEPHMSRIFDLVANWLKEQPAAS